MFDSLVNKHFDSACRHFNAEHNTEGLALEANIKPQVLRNKLNPDQPHQLTAIEVIRLTTITGDRSLIDGLLMQADCLPSVPCNQVNADINYEALNAVIAVGGMAQEVKEIKNGQRITQTRKNKILGYTSHLIACASMIAFSLESRFHSTPTLAAAIDFVSSVGAMPGLS